MAGTGQGGPAGARAGPGTAARHPCCPAGPCTLGSQRCRIAAHLTRKEARCPAISRRPQETGSDRSRSRLCSAEE